MKLYCHSVLTNNKSHDNKLIKNACEKIVLNIFFKAQIEMKREVEKILVSEYRGGREILKNFYGGKGVVLSEEMEVLKENLKERAVEKYSGLQELNLTELAKENSINITRAREELESLGGKWFTFNFINRKKIPVELHSRVVKDVNFVQKEEGLIFQYHIPVPILKFLVFPDQYAPVDMNVIRRLKFKYAIKFYLLVLDHKKRGILELKKDEIMECFSLPKSYSKDRNLFLKKCLIPTLKELKEVAGIKLIYDFKQNYSFQKLELKIERNQNNFSKNLLEKIEYAKQNQYIKKSWDGKVHEFLLDFYNDKGEDMTRQLLQKAYQSVNNPLKIPLQNYLLILWKKIEVDIQEKKIQTTSGDEKNHETDPSVNLKFSEKITSWEYYTSLPESEQKIYGNLARMLFEEKLGTKKYPEDCFKFAFRSMINEIIEME